MSSIGGFKADYIHIYIYTYTYMYIDVGNQGKISNAFFLGGNRFSAPLEIRSAVGLTRLLLTARQFSIGKKPSLPSYPVAKDRDPLFWSFSKVPGILVTGKCTFLRVGFSTGIYGTFTVIFLHFPELVALQEMKRLFCV